MDHLALNQRFYRALFRATQAYSGGDETEPARENLHAYVRLAQRAIASGLLRPDLDADAFGEVLTSLWAANMRNWASSDGDIQVAAALIEFSFAAALAGVAVGAAEGRMRERLLRSQAAYRRMIASAGAPSTAG